MKPLKFIKEVVVELYSVRWPDLKSLWTYTIVVLVTVAIASLVLSAMDASFGQLIKTFISF